MIRWLLILPPVIGLVWYLAANKQAVPHSFPPSMTGWVDPDAFPPLQRRLLEFPRDHGSHSGAALESWQILGVLTTVAGHKLAFQLHIFSLGLHPEKPQRASAWAANRYYLGYFTRTDGRAKDFQVEQRSERAIPGLAGSNAGKIWLDDWSLRFGSGPVHLRAGARGNYLVLSLYPSTPPHGLQTDAWLNLYHWHQLKAKGHWGQIPVTGSAWMEHAWGSLPLPGGAATLQRFQLQLRDGRDLFCLAVHHENIDPAAQCVLETSDGGQPLSTARITITARWQAPGDRAYPVAWRLESGSLDLHIDAVIPDQWIPQPVPFWSGWVQVDDGSGMAGEGFVTVLGGGK